MSKNDLISGHQIDTEIDCLQKLSQLFPSLYLFLESGLALICFVPPKTQWKTLAYSESGPHEALCASAQSLGTLPAAKQTNPGSLVELARTHRVETIIPARHGDTWQGPAKMSKAIHRYLGGPSRNQKTTQLITAQITSLHNHGLNKW